MKIAVGIPNTIKASLGTDELFLWPVTAHLQELHRLAEARGDRGLKP